MFDFSDIPENPDIVAEEVVEIAFRYAGDGFCTIEGPIVILSEIRSALLEKGYLVEPGLKVDCTFFPFKRIYDAVSSELESKSTNAIEYRVIWEDLSLAERF